MSDETRQLSDEIRQWLKTENLLGMCEIPVKDLEDIANRVEELEKKQNG